MEEYTHNFSRGESAPRDIHFNLANFEMQSGISIRFSEPVMFHLQSRTLFRSEEPHLYAAHLHTGTNTLIVQPTDITPADSVLTPADLARMTLPVVGFIQEQKPDIIIACDRGGRLFALSVFHMWNTLTKTAFPSYNGVLYHRKLRRSPQPEAAATLKEIIREAGLDTPRFLFIDDWIISGATRDLINDSLEALKQARMMKNYQTAFALMCGNGGDVSGGEEKIVLWHDNPQVIGVDYDSHLVPYAVHGDNRQSSKIRSEIYHEVKMLVRTLQV